MRAGTSRFSKIHVFTILWVIFYLVCLWLTFVPGFPVNIGIYIILIAGIPLTVLMSIDWSDRFPTRKSVLIMFIAGFAIWIATALMVRAEYNWRIWHPVNSVSLIFTGYLIGFWLTGELEKAGHLIPVSILGTVVDIMSVFQGPSKKVGEQVTEHVSRQIETGTWQPPPFLEFAILSFPSPGADFMTPVFGFGDLVFIALFIGGSRRFGLSVWLNTLLLVLGLAASVICSSLINKPIPALPFICGCFLLGNFRKLELSKTEWRLTLIVSGIVVVVGLLNFLGKIFTFSN